MHCNCALIITRKDVDDFFAKCEKMREIFQKEIKDNKRTDSQFTTFVAVGHRKHDLARSSLSENIENLMVYSEHIV